MSETISDDKKCFCCGSENRHGLGMTFEYPEEGTAVSELTVPDWFSGWKDITHGGFTATVLDEIMAHACVSLGKHGFTAELSVRFKNPLKTGSRIRAEGRIVKTRGSIAETEARIFQGETLIATGNARFFLKNPSGK